jgi:hypothetical protein
MRRRRQELGRIVDADPTRLSLHRPARFDSPSVAAAA